MAKEKKPEEKMYVHKESLDEPIFAPVEPPAPVKVLVPEPPKAPMASRMDEAPTAESIVRRLAALSPPHLGGSAGVQLLNDARAWAALQEPQ